MMAHFLQNEEGISPGDRFMNGRYQVIQKLASGGQANVLLVKDTIEKIEYTFRFWIFSKFDFYKIVVF